MIKKTITLLSALLLLCFCPVTATEKTWQLSLDKNGVAVYTKPADNSVFDEFKGVVVVNADIDVLEMILRDIPSFPLWMSGCKESPIIEEIDKNNYIFYYVQGLPWPLTDRDTALKAKAEFDRKNGFYSVHFHSIDDPRVPLRTGRIRMNMEGGFTLRRTDSDRTTVTFFIKANPGGAIPGIIANIFSREIPYETLLGMKDIAKEDKYINLAAKRRSGSGSPEHTPEDR